MTKCFKYKYCKIFNSNIDENSAKVQNNIQQIWFLEINIQWIRINGDRDFLGGKRRKEDQS